METRPGFSKHFLPYDLSEKIQEVGFEFDFQVWDKLPYAKYVSDYPEQGLRSVWIDEDKPSGFHVYAPLNDQAIDWLSQQGLHISEIWYDDGVTPPRWTYHINKQYIAGGDIHITIGLAIEMLREQTINKTLSIS